MAEFIVIVEGTADEKIATELAERIFLEKIDWIEPYLSHNVQWRGLLEETSCSYWSHIKQIIQHAKEQGIRIPRYFRGRGLNADGAGAQKILHLVRELRENRPIKAVLLIRDLDNQEERRAGLTQAREQYSHLSPQVEIVIGTANPKREAWVLNGFRPLVNGEQERLDEIVGRLNFDPCIEPERLRETSRTMPERERNIKVVLEMLTGGDFERERICWRETSLDLLRERGTNTGLTDYLAEVELRLVPIVEKG